MDLKQQDARPGGPAFELNNAIEAIYRSTDDPAAWRDVAQRLAGLFDAEAVVLCCGDGDTLRVLGEGLYNVTPEDAAKLPVSYSHKSLAVAAHHSGGQFVRTLDDAGFAREVSRLPAGARVLTVVIPELDRTEPRHATHLSVARADGRMAFSANQQDLRVLVSRHLVEAVRIQRRFARRQRTADFHSMAILHLGEAWLVMDRQMALVDCNPLARSFLMRSDTLRLRDGHVLLPSESLIDPITQAMAVAWNGARGQVTVTSPEDGGQIGLEFYPWFPNNQRSSDQPECIMVLVRELDRELMLKIEAKAETCGLSRAERRVMVQLVRSGQPPAAIAAAIGTSERTVRCQLSSIFRKTGARNQQDLIRMTLTGS